MDLQEYNKKVLEVVTRSLKVELPVPAVLEKTVGTVTLSETQKEHIAFLTELQTNLDKISFKLDELQNKIAKTADIVKANPNIDNNVK